MRIKEKTTRNNLKKGISLIVLVITIIVMIILAAAVILSLSSSGIIGRANNAVDKTNLAQVQTLAQTIWSEIYLENLEGANLDYETEVPKRLGDQKIDTTKYNINADASGVTVTLKGTYKIAPGLYESGAIAINEELGTDVSDKMKTSWEELLQDGVVHVENGKVYTNWDDTNWNNSSASLLNGDLVLPSTGITTIGEDAFMYCEGLTNVTIPDSVTTIGESAFKDCEALTNVTIPDSVTTIGESAFMYCHALTNVTIPDSVTIIEAKTFCNSMNLTSVTIPDSVTTIGESTFDACYALNSIVFLGTVEQWNSINKMAYWYVCPLEITVVCSDGTVILPANYSES